SLRHTGVMGVTIAVAFLHGCLHTAIQAIYLAASSLVIITLKLNGGMANVILLAEHRGERLQDRRTSTWRKIIYEGMAGEGIHATGNCPDMQIMHVPYAFDPLHIIDK